MSTPDSDRVDIVMGTYNGAKYIRPQLESILAQTYPNWHLWIGDDKSVDTTPMILEDLQKKFPDKVSIQLFQKNAGVTQNYTRLLDLSEADYVMFCDQDDVWFPEKIAKTLAKMKELETKWGKEGPLLVHTDMKVVDDELKVIDDSQWKRQKLNPKRSGKLNAVLMQNASWGCTMMVNRNLINLATPIPTEGFVHDFWFVLVASACGHVDYLNEPTMLYRQHADNWVGSKSADFRWFINNVIKDPTYQSQTEMRMMKCMVRGYIFYKRYYSFLDDQQKEMVENFIDLKYQPLWKELYLRFKYGFLNHGFWSNVGLLLATARMGKADPRYRPQI